MRPIVGSSHALWAVNGSSTTVTRWKVVSHSRSVWDSSSVSGLSSSSAGAASVTIGAARYQPNRARLYSGPAEVAFARMHPIERLRYVARAGDADAAVLVQEAAGALAGLGD